MDRKMKHVLILFDVVCITLAVMFGMTSELMRSFQKIKITQKNVEDMAVSESSYVKCVEVAVSEPRVVDETLLIRKKCYELSDMDYENLLRIVEAEATGEDLEGRILVANVVMNRVKSSKFPDSVTKVIMQMDNGNVQFSPVSDGRFWRVKVSALTQEAVEQVIYGTDDSNGALYFVSARRADQAKYSWFKTRLSYLFSHGGHEFYK